MTLPRHADAVVIGAGSAGAAVAGLLAERSDMAVVVLEAGPDYGPMDSGRWPEGLLDPAIMTFSHDWGYSGEVGGRQVRFPRARVVGGCSAINGAAAVHGSRVDYDGWAAAGNRGWDADALAPLFQSAWRRLKVARVDPTAVTPFQAACLQAITTVGIPAVDDLNDLDENCGVAPFPTNTSADGVRVSSAFGYLDPVRACPTLNVIADAAVERITIKGDRVTGVVGRAGSEVFAIETGRVVVSAGAYGSPAILLRSGVGPADHLSAVGVPVVHALAGVGANLHDQPTIQVDYAGTEELARAMRRFVHTGRRRDEQVIAKFPSEECTEGFDLHIFPIGGPRDDPDAAGRNAAFSLGGAVLGPRSRGAVRLTGPALTDRLAIDHRYLTDPEGSDLTRLVEVVERIRGVAAEPELAALLGEETFPGPGVTSSELRACIAGSVVHYYHPAGACRMGPATDDRAVVGADGAVHGIEGLFVADASVMPTVVSGNTNIPTVVIGEKLGRLLTGEPGGDLAYAGPGAHHAAS
ncbi:MAG TPA: GMC family oxidoreductase [Solirubrobacteraceae bacterium]|jgi:choline dehydrogenase|nr:GMC family oxidoreductase [Solirubrobacteraceae bacterium]